MYSRVVTEYALSVADAEYTALPRIFGGVNSNSAAQAIANNASGVFVSTPGSDNYGANNWEDVTFNFSHHVR